MTDQKQENIIPPAPFICEECIQHRAERHRKTGTIIVYCSHSATGASFHPSRGWMAWSPIDAESFLKAVDGAAADLEAALQAH